MRRNKFKIPEEALERLRKPDQACAYCRRKMVYPYERGRHWESATIEHLREEGPFYWTGDDTGLLEEDLVICCGSCNSSRGKKTLTDWFDSKYCSERKITRDSVSKAVQNYLERLEKKAR